MTLPSFSLKGRVVPLTRPLYSCLEIVRVKSSLKMKSVERRFLHRPFVDTFLMSLGDFCTSLTKVPVAGPENSPSKEVDQQRPRSQNSDSRTLCLSPQLPQSRKLSSNCSILARGLWEKSVEFIFSREKYKNKYTIRRFVFTQSLLTTR